MSDPTRPSELANVTDENSVYGGEFGPDGHTLALAEEGHKATLWDLRDPATPKRLSTMTGQSSSVFTAEFCPDGLLLATGGLDKTVIIWNITNPRQPSELIQRSGFPGAIGLSLFRPDGRTLAISSGAAASLWDVGDLEQIVAQPVQVACTITGHGLTPQQWRDADIGFPLSADLLTSNLRHAARPVGAADNPNGYLHAALVRFSATSDLLRVASPGNLGGGKSRTPPRRLARPRRRGIAGQGPLGPCRQSPHCHRRAERGSPPGDEHP